MGIEQYSRESRIRDLLKSPIGHDVIAKLLMQTGKSMSAVENPIVGSMKIKQLKTLAPKIVDDGLISAILDLINSHTDTPQNTGNPPKEAWWKESVIYQIYPRSFQDSNGDGIGDLNGIASKLDYLKSLGVDIIWLSPIYDSPNDDMGYDIRDYRAIMREFGTMEDFDSLLGQVHARGMKLIMDLVINHTSDEHKWFQQALKDKNSPYHDYYIWKNSEKPGQAPNNWSSWFSGGAWNYYEEQDAWALHLFSKKQMDLNWDNEALRHELYDMINWWLGKGIDGFRMDVINLISKTSGLPDGNPVVGKMMGLTGIEKYFYGPHLHEYLKELRKETFDQYDVVTVGETPGPGMEMCKLLTGDYRQELDMVFCFDHLDQPGKSRFDGYRYDLNYLKQIFMDWQMNYGNACWNSLFLENHDNPRMISKVNPDPQYRQVLGKLLAMIQLTLKGTPFVFQGQELGMINNDFTSLDDFRDVESINYYNEHIGTLGGEEAFRRVKAGSRDHARTPMQWSSAENGGFTTGTPWIDANKDYHACNAEVEAADANSIYSFYKAMIALRHANKALVYGDFIPVKPKLKDLFCYYRTLDGVRFYIEVNLCREERAKPESTKSFERLLSNYPGEAQKLRPYEATIYRA